MNMTEMMAPDIPTAESSFFGRSRNGNTVELHQHVVVDQDHAEEDRSEFY